MKCTICGKEFDPSNLTSVFIHQHQYNSEELAAQVIGIKGKKVEELYTKRELEIAYCSGLLNQVDLTIDKLSDQITNQKFPMILEFIESLRKEETKTHSTTEGSSDEVL